MNCLGIVQLFLLGCGLVKRLNLEGKKMRRRSSNSFLQNGRSEKNNIL